MGLWLVDTVHIMLVSFLNSGFSSICKTTSAEAIRLLAVRKEVMRTRFCEPSWTGCAETSSWIL